MGGHRFAFVLVAAVGAVSGVAALAAPARAQPADEIEMEPEPGPEPGNDSETAAPEAPPPVAVVKDPRAARKWFLAGTQLVQKGDYFTRTKKLDDATAQYQNAVTAFEKAIEASPDLNYHFDLANVEAKLGKHDRAALHYRILIKAESGVKPDILKKATAKYDDVMMKVGLVTLVVTPEGAAITLAGAPVGTSPLPEPLILMPGTYSLAFEAEGFQPKETEIKVEEGSESERTIALEPVKIIIETAPPVEDDEMVLAPVVAKAPSKLPLYIGGGATIAFVGVATVAGILAVGEHGTFTSADSSVTERANAKSSGERLATITDLALAGAVVAGGVTAYWYVFKYKPGQRAMAAERKEPIGAKVDVLPWVKSDAGGLVVAGSF